MFFVFVPGRSHSAAVHLQVLRANAAAARRANVSSHGGGAMDHRRFSGWRGRLPNVAALPVLSEIGDNSIIRLPTAQWQKNSHVCRCGWSARSCKRDVSVNVHCDAWSPHVSTRLGGLKLQRSARSGLNGAVC